MLLIEVFVPRGVFDEDGRQALGRRLIDALLVEDESHGAQVLDAQRELTQVLVHEPAGWVLGTRTADEPAGPPRYLVRLTAPGAWRKEMSADVIETFTEVLAATEAEAGRDPERLRRAPHATIHVLGVSEGGICLFGRPMGSMDLAEWVTRPYRASAAGRPRSAAEDGTLIDPVCGMTVDPGPDAITLDVEGDHYGFCHGMCRRLFADEHGVAPVGEGRRDENAAAR